MVLAIEVLKYFKFESILQRKILTENYAVFGQVEKARCTMEYCPIVGQTLYLAN